MEKPDFERISKAFGDNPELLMFVESQPEVIDSYNSITLPDKESLIALLTEYNQLNFLNDYYFLACKFTLWKQDKFEAKSSNQLEKSKRKELLKALKLMYSERFEVDIRSSKFKSKAIIKNSELKNIIKESLFNLFVKREVAFVLRWAKVEEVENFEALFSFLLEAEREKAGRHKEQLLTGACSNYLQRYLQEFTDLKTEGITISNQQALFIYKFLNILNFFKEELSYKEDNIRKILNSHRDCINNYSFNLDFQKMKQKRESFTNFLNSNKKK